MDRVIIKRRYFTLVAFIMQLLCCSRAGYINLTPRTLHLWTVPASCFCRVYLWLAIVRQPSTSTKAMLVLQGFWLQGNPALQLPMVYFFTLTFAGLLPRSLLCRSLPLLSLHRQSRNQRHFLLLVLAPFLRFFLAAAAEVDTHAGHVQQLPFKAATVSDFTSTQSK